MINNIVFLWCELIYLRVFVLEKEKVWIDRNRLIQLDGMRDKQISREVNGWVFMVFKWMNGNKERWICEQININILDGQKKMISQCVGL